MATNGKIKVFSFVLAMVLVIILTPIIAFADDVEQNHFEEIQYYNLSERTIKAINQESELFKKYSNAIHTNSSINNSKRKCRNLLESFPELVADKEFKDWDTLLDKVNKANILYAKKDEGKALGYFEQKNDIPKVTIFNNVWDYKLNEWRKATQAELNEAWEHEVEGHLFHARYDNSIYPNIKITNNGFIATTNDINLNEVAKFRGHFFEEGMAEYKRIRKNPDWNDNYPESKYPVATYYMAALSEDIIGYNEMRIAYNSNDKSAYLANSIRKLSKINNTGVELTNYQINEMFGRLEKYTDDTYFFKIAVDNSAKIENLIINDLTSFYKAIKGQNWKIDSGFVRKIHFISEAIEKEQKFLSTNYLD